MLRLVFFARLYQRSKGALHPFLHGSHGLRVPLQSQKEAAVLRFNTLHDSLGLRAQTRIPGAGVSTA